MEVLTHTHHRSASAGTVDELLASLALREPSVCSTSAEETGIGVEDAELDEEALSDQDSQQLQVRCPAAPLPPGRARRRALVGGQQTGYPSLRH
jgi:hypothetical protein